ncbi:MAG: alpha/beta fold hydrolase [Chloroflexota bacterium]
MMASVACGGAADESNVELVTNTPLPTATAVPDESEPSAQAVTETPASATAEPTATEEAATEEPTAEPTPTPSPTALPVNELTYPVEFVPGDCPFPLPDHPSAIECGTIEVPEARANADNGRTITLSVAVFRSVARGALADPIIYLDGGPGGNTLEVVQFTYSNLIAPYVTERDFIIFDQRGIGYSEPSLDCPEILDLTLESLNGQFSEEEELDLYLLAIDDCRSRLASEGVNLRAFNSAESAADVEDIRRALGYESLNLYGISYGTRLAQTIMRDYPDHIRSVILDSPVPIEGDLQAETPIHISQALAKFFKGCAEDEACGVAYPELENRFYALVDTLNEAPITFPITYILTGNRYDVVFSGEDFIDMLFQSLYSDEIFPLMPAVISQVEEGSYDQLSLVFTNFLINNEFISYGMYYSVNCQEEFAFSDRVAVEQNSQADPLLIDYLDSWETTFDTCDVWDVGEANTIENEPVVSDIPTLILAGEYDPITPIGWGLQIEGNLGRDTFVPFPSVGHGVTTSDPCGAEIALSFLFEPALTPDMSCTQDVGDPAFEVPREVATTPDEIVMVPFEGDFFGVPFAGAKPESWEGVPDIDGTFIRGDTPFDQTFLQHQVLELGVFSDIEVSILTYLNQLSEDEAQAVEPYVDTGEREWRMYEFSFQGIPAIGGFANQEEILFFIFLTYQTEEEGAFLVENVLQPSMDAVVSE